MSIAGEVRDFDPLDYMERKEIRRSDRFVHFAVAAAGQALKSARLEITPELAQDIAVKRMFSGWYEVGYSYCRIARISGLEPRHEAVELFNLI